MKNDTAVSEIIGTILIIILVVAFAALIAALFMGLVDLAPKSAFIAPDITNQTIFGKNVIKLYNRGGDTATLDISGQGLYPMGVYIDSSAGSSRAIPLPQTSQFRPGDILYVCNTTTGYRITNNISSVSDSWVHSLPSGQVGVRLVDENSHLLIAKWNTSIGGPSPTPVSPPAADFTGSPVSGNVPFAVQFTDTSTGGSPMAWSWNFGDGNTSALQSPNHTYSTAGAYTVSLMATNSGGNTTRFKNGYIIATQPGFSVWAWVKWINKPNIPNPVPANLANQTYATIVLGGSSNLNRQYHLQHDQYDTKFEFDVTTVTAAAAGGQGVHVWSNTNPNNGSWYLVTGVYDQKAGRVAIYVNGTQEGAWGSADSSGLRAYSGGQQVGGPGGICYAGTIPCTSKTRILNGSIYGVQTFDYVKNPAEILAYYNAGHPA